jgi:hypothetical protein
MKELESFFLNFCRKVNRLALQDLSRNILPEKAIFRVQQKLIAR